MDSILIRVKVAAQSLRVADEAIASMPARLESYDKARAEYVSAELNKIKANLDKGPFQSGLKSAITTFQKMLDERR